MTVDGSYTPRTEYSLRAPDGTLLLSEVISYFAAQLGIQPNDQEARETLLDHNASYVPKGTVLVKRVVLIGEWVEVPPDA